MNLIVIAGCIVGGMAIGWVAADVYLYRTREKRWDKARRWSKGD